MPKIKIWIGCILVILIICVIICVSTGLLFELPFVTQQMGNVEKIVVVIEPYYGGESREVHITNQPELGQVYELLKATRVVDVNRYPSHLSSLQFDPKFAIRVEYMNGKIDRYSASGPDGIFRNLDTMTSHGDQGYIMGSNEELWKYVLNL